MKYKITDFEQVKAFILKYKINQALIAAAIGIKSPSFSEKMKEQRYNKFTEEHKEKITNYLKKMAQDIENI